MRPSHMTQPFLNCIWVVSEEPEMVSFSFECSNNFRISNKMASPIRKLEVY